MRSESSSSKSLTFSNKIYWKIDRRCGKLDLIPTQSKAFCSGFLLFFLLASDTILSKSDSFLRKFCYIFFETYLCLSLPFRFSISEEWISNYLSISLTIGDEWSKLKFSIMTMKAFVMSDYIWSSYCLYSRWSVW